MDVVTDLHVLHKGDDVTLIIDYMRASPQVTHLCEGTGPNTPPGDATDRTEPKLGPEESPSSHRVRVQVCAHALSSLTLHARRPEQNSSDDPRRNSTTRVLSALPGSLPRRSSSSRF